MHFEVSIQTTFQLLMFGFFSAIAARNLAARLEICAQIAAKNMLSDGYTIDDEICNVA